MTNNPYLSEADQDLHIDFWLLSGYFLVIWYHLWVGLTDHFHGNTGLRLEFGYSFGIKWVFVFLYFCASC